MTWNCWGPYTEWSDQADRAADLAREPRGWTVAGMLLGCAFAAAVVGVVGWVAGVMP
jgi:hypothetical protein